MARRAYASQSVGDKTFHMKTIKIIIALWRVLCCPVIYVAAQVFVMVVWTVAVSAKMTVEALRENGGAMTDELNEKLTRDVTAMVQSQTIPIMLVALCLTLLVMWVILRDEWKREMFWKAPGVPAAAIVLCALLGAPLNLFTSGAVYFTGLTEMFPDYEEMTSNIIGNNLLLEIITVAVLAPAVEEVIFRGTVLKRLLSRPSPRAARAVIIQAFLFALIHANVVQGLYTFLFGAALGLTYIWFDTVWAPMAVHVTYNLFAVVAGNLGGGQTPEIKPNGAAMAFMTGAAFIISAGLMVLMRKKYAKGREGAQT